jgi:hypothetical protein
MFTKIFFFAGVAVGVVYFALRYGPMLLAMMFGN